MKCVSIKRLQSIEGKRVMVRVDFNVPLKRKVVLDDAKLRASLPTIQYLVEKKAKVILVTHLGRPQGKVVKSLQVQTVGECLSELLKQPIYSIGVSGGSVAVRAIKELEPGGIILLENIRFDAHEKDNAGDLGKRLAALADIFVLDGFAVAHRNDASIVGVAPHMPSYAGLLLQKEIKGLDTILKHPKSPFVVIMGGIKIETKIPVIKQLLPNADVVLVGGGLCNTYLRGMGYGTGDSVVDMDMKRLAVHYGKKKKVIMPVDVIVGDFKGKHTRVVEIQSDPHQICGLGEAILDIGPKTIELFSTYIQKAKMIAWNGALGYFEQKPYQIGTFAIAELVAERSKGGAYGVIGGGETLQVMEILGLKDSIDLVSTGGGAMLQYLGGEILPGIAVLQKKHI
ncbi:phosphoglycerate kinase [Patescibacteria group bacterium]|nr:phosphoglycerate kinase [Patescibacteria group bacterium]MBU1722181.1 phosphoglycerate kinase [Patescibacteria group bacterium]MBU1901132.1 phosphoglycerate kinase [Patescibacteria group bacterium]